MLRATAPAFVPVWAASCDATRSHSSSEHITEHVGDRLIRELADLCLSPVPEKASARQPEVQMPLVMRNEVRCNCMPSHGLFCPLCVARQPCAFHRSLCCGLPSCMDRVGRTLTDASVQESRGHSPVLAADLPMRKLPPVPACLPPPPPPPGFNEELDNESRRRASVPASPAAPPGLFEHAASSAQQRCLADARAHDLDDASTDFNGSESFCVDSDASEQSMASSDPKRRTKTNARRQHRVQMPLPSKSAVWGIGGNDETPEHWDRHVRIKRRSVQCMQ